MVSLLQVDLNEENSRKEKFLLLYFSSLQTQKELPQGKLPHSRQQFKWYICTQEHQLLFLPTHGKYLYYQHLSF